MASTDVQVEDGYTRIAHRLLVAIALAPWDTPSQVTVLLALMRVSYGVQRTEAAVGYSEWRKLTGLSDATLSRALVSLQQNGVVRCVRAQDSKTHRPKLWRLEKRWTHWKRYRVATEAIDVAEAVATQRLRTIPPPVDDPGVVDGEGSPVTPGSRTTPDQGSPVRRGHAQEPYSPNGLRPPKDSKDKEKLSSRAKRGRAPRVGSEIPIPDDWLPNATHGRIAAEEGRDVNREAAVFRSHAQSHGRVLLDWDAGFRTWLRKANDMGTGPPNGHRPPRVPSPSRDLRGVP